MTRETPRVLAIAGSDSSGGAGIQADIKTIAMLGGYAMTAITAVTAQNTVGVQAIAPLGADMVSEQIASCIDDIGVDAIKIGMLGEAPVIATVAERLAHWKAERVVLDPVMVAKSGDALLASAAVGALREALVPLARVITPNLPEAGVLLESRAPESVKEMTRAAERLHRLMGNGERWVWLKGGHLPGGDATDLLFNGDRMIEISRPRVETKNTHGTGCTLSAALAALLPQRPDVPAAAQDAKDYLTEALRQADTLRIGQGHGPVHHFHALWPATQGNRR